jgi:hypothetical protein
MYQLAPATSFLPAALPAGLVCLPPAAANQDGLLAYNPTTTPPRLVPIIQAQATTKVRDLSDRDLDQLLIGQIQQAARRMNHRNAVQDGLETNLMARDVAALLRDRWSYLTKGEVEQVFYLGSMGELLPPPGPDGQPTEEVVYLASKSFGTWLRRYKYDVKTQAMAHVQRLAYQFSELPHHHPVHAAWRIARVVALASLSPETLRKVSAREGDFKNLLFQWLKEIGALGFKAKPAGFWDRLEELEKRQLRRTGQRPPEEAMLAMATGKRETYAERLTAAKRWRTLCLWLVGHRQRGTDLAALLTPLAATLYTPPTNENR